MGWENRQRGGRYYYRSVRQDGLPRKLYFGNGKAATKFAQLDAEKRQQRQADHEALLAEQAQVSPADLALAELRTVIHLLAKATLLAQDYHLHRGEWRRWRQRDDPKAQGCNP